VFKVKKDIKIPEVKDVYIAVVKEPVSETDFSEWNIYIINDKPEDLNIVIIVSQGFSKTKKTSTLRKKIDNLPKKSYAKFEMLHEDLLEMTNQFTISYFQDNTLFDRTFTLAPNSIAEANLNDIPLLESKGILAE